MLRYNPPVLNNICCCAVSPCDTNVSLFRTRHTTDSYVSSKIDLWMKQTFDVTNQMKRPGKNGIERGQLGFRNPLHGSRSVLIGVMQTWFMHHCHCHKFTTLKEAVSCRTCFTCSLVGAYFLWLSPQRPVEGKQLQTWVKFASDLFWPVLGEFW